MASFRLLLVLALVAITCLLSSALSVAAVPSSAAAPYVEGLDALNEGHWPEAATAFTRALDKAGDNPDLVLAHGVASVLAEDFSRALKDLERATRLGYRGREPELWTYVTEAMSGLVAVPDHVLGAGPRGVPSGPVVVSIPGHIAQGHDDYTTEYGSFLVYRLGMEYQKHRLPADSGGSGNPAGAKSPQIRQAMLKAGQLFAEKNYRRPELASISVTRAKQASGGSSTQGNVTHVERALAASPGNPDAHYQAALAWLEAGRPASARKEFTIALTQKTDLADAYTGRAAAAAKQGDEKRMGADLAVYKKGGWFSTRSTRSAVESELSSNRVKRTPESLLKDLQDAARSGKTQEELTAIASQLHRAMGEQRLRYDEIYQDHVRVLEEAVRDNPKNPDRLVGLAAYFVEEADNRGEKIEPRREIQPYRFQVSRENELRRAIQLSDQALGLNGKHVAAMMQKALALTALKQYNEADKLADQALELSGNDPDALRLYARFRAMRANQMSAEASSLRQERCSSSTHEDRRSDGVYQVTTTTCYPPSQADLTRAAQLDAMAAELRRRARAAMEKAAKVTKGTVDGLLILADLALWDGKTVEAQGYFEQAVKLDPKSLEAQDRLVQHYAQSGQQEKAEEQRLIAANLVQTTVAPLLRLAWTSTEKTAWQAAKGYLSRASRIDPEDARIPAYLGVVNEGDEKREEAMANYRTALALEEARLQLDEQKPETGSTLGRDAMEFGLAIQARFHLARLADQSKKQAEALAQYQAVLRYEKRMNRGFESRQMFTAMWPDQKPDKGALVMAPRNAATLVADAHLRTGKLLAAMGKHGESVEHLRAAAMFGPMRMAGMPQIGNAEGNTNFGHVAGAPAAEAQLALAKELVATGDIKGAQAALWEVGRDLPDHLRKELNDLNLQMTKMPFPHPPDPYAEAAEEQDRPAKQQAQQEWERRRDERNRYFEQQARRDQDFRREDNERRAAVQAQRDRDRARQSLRHLTPIATIIPGLVGRWEMQPDDPSMPNGTLTIDANSAYTLISSDNRPPLRGTMYTQNRQRTRRAKSEPSRGQMILYDDATEKLGTMSFEFSGDGMIEIIGMTGTKYVTKRRQ
jgi:Tfp pilus assembly protein PilF